MKKGIGNSFRLWSMKAIDFLFQSFSDVILESP
jgi:hypothetical protein